MELKDVFAGHPRTYVIAEIGHNHQGSLSLAKELIAAAKECGADAAKLQKRSNQNLYTSSMFNKPYENPNSFGKTYGEHRNFLEFNFDQYAELAQFSKGIGIDFFATAFDFESANFLRELGVPAFKIASGDLTNTPLIEHIASFGLPIFISSGGGSITDVVRAVEVLETSDAQYCVMQCTAGYPPDWSELNLRVISTFRDLFPNAVIGFSSHDNGIAMGVAAYVLGARVIEKHFTLNRTMKGTDHAFSLEPQGLAKLCRDLRRLEIALGDGQKRPYPSESAPIHKMSKSIVAAVRIRKGERISEGMIALKSPGGYGLPPWRYKETLGMQATRDYEIDDLIQP